MFLQLKLCLNISTGKIEWVTCSTCSIPYTVYADASVCIKSPSNSNVPVSEDTWCNTM